MAFVLFPTETSTTITILYPPKERQGELERGRNMELQSLFKLHHQPSFLPRLSLVSTSLTPLFKTTFFTPKKKFPHLHKPFSPHQSSPSPSCRPPKLFSVSAASVALETGEDRLPADIEVIETKEPHSRVSIF